MTLPPGKLLSHLWHRQDGIALHAAGGGTVERIISPGEALALAQKGVVEGVIKGKLLRAVRWLHAGQIPDSNLLYRQAGEEVYSSRSGVIANTDMGVYREKLSEVTVERKRVTGRGGIAGFVYTHKANADLSYESLDRDDYVEVFFCGKWQSAVVVEALEGSKGRYRVRLADGSTYEASRFDIRVKR